MRVQRIAMIGSRTLPHEWCRDLRALACALAARGYAIVSGGCPTGADHAAALGVGDYDEGASLTLYPDAARHAHITYPPKALTVYPDLDAQSPEWQLARACASPGQWQSRYRGFCVRNAYVASDADIAIAWRTGPSRGTNHTLKCMQVLGRPCLLCDASWQRNPWKTPLEFIERVVAALER
jgi:predicted Rossmann fold nucleotide-binding protein DprA/Smf involved in DNA uptake